MTDSLITSHIKLLEIRMKRYRRNVIITGSIFLLSLFAFFALGMLEMVGNPREIYLIALILVLIGISFITVFIRYESIKNVNELAQVISRSEEVA